MEEAGFQIRAATKDDVDKIKENIKYTLANPEGRTQRKKYADAVDRNEILVLTRYDPKERVDEVHGFIEWHTKVDGTVTIRDAGTSGEQPNVSLLKRLVRELLRLLHPPTATVKVRADQPDWNAVFRETPGFIFEGKEFSRPHYRNIYEWSAEAERLALRGARRALPRAARGR